MSGKTLDVITIGRSSVDLYGQQIGTRLEDIASFAKSVGGCPCNIAVGTARLGLKSALLTRVGNEQMGRFIREQLAREGVETRGIVTDPERLTALVLLAVEGEGISPMIFYRTDCADMALDEGDVDEGFIASARAVVVTGTHFSQEKPRAAQRKAIRLAKANGALVVFDLDYRPNLWGLGGHEAGFDRFKASASVTEVYRSVLADCDLIVGTEEEVFIASGETGIAAALKAIRRVSDATIVLKRGPMGCIVYDGAIPDELEDGVVGQGFPIEVYNVLGAGDAFLSGFLRGWLAGEDHAVSATWANACGAMAVSRLMCAPEYPSWTELRHFLDKGSPVKALRKDAVLNHIHHATTRRREIPQLMALAIDHRSQLEALCAGDADKIARLDAFKVLALKAAVKVAGGRPGFGMLLDETYGRSALFEAVQHDLWIGRPVEKPGSRPLEFEFGPDLGSRLVEWPVEHCVKVLCFFRPDDDAELKRRQIERLIAAQQAARGIGCELLIEIIASKHGPVEDHTTATVLRELYAAGLKPDWWKLEPQPSAAGWAAVDEAIAQGDEYCRGVVMLGLEAPQAELEQAFAIAKASKSVRGFAVGRTIFAEAAADWLDGRIGDEQAAEAMAERFAALVAAWQG